MNWLKLSRQLLRVKNNSKYDNRYSSSTFSTILNGEIDTTNDSYQVNLEKFKILETKLCETQSKVLECGGQKAIMRHLKQGKILARDRIKNLLDPGSDSLELSMLAGLSMPYGDVPAAGVISVIGIVQGRPCMIVVNDATVKGGTLFPISVKKQLRSQEISEHNRIPCIYIVDSGGAFLPLQADIFPDKNHGGRVFYNEAVMSAKGIHQIAIVCGSCTAGAAYVPTMADEAVIVDRIGHVFLAGPPLVQAALGVKISADDLGGAMVHSSISGCTDHFAKTEADAFQTTRDIIASLNLPELEHEENVQDPIFDAAELRGLVPYCNQHTMDMYKIISRIVDGSRFHEFKEKFGSTLITGFSYLNGHLIGIVANNGQITDAAATKATHFLQLCTQRNVPVVFLQNTHPSDTFLGDIANGMVVGETVRAQGRLMAAVSCTHVPKITVIVGNSYGMANYMMAGRSTSPRFLFTWPNAKISLMEEGEMFNILIQESIHSTDKTHDESEKMKTKFAFESSAFYSSNQVHDDGIILPQNTRKVLSQCLQIVKYSDQLPSCSKNQIQFKM